MASRKWVELLFSDSYILHVWNSRFTCLYFFTIYIFVNLFRHHLYTPISFPFAVLSAPRKKKNLRSGAKKKKNPVTSIFVKKNRSELSRRIVEGKILRKVLGRDSKCKKKKIGAKNKIIKKKKWAIYWGRQFKVNSLFISWWRNLRNTWKLLK